MPPNLNRTTTRLSKTATTSARKGTGSETARAIQQMGTSHLSSRASRVRSGGLASIFRRIPYPLLRLLPFVRQDTQQLIQKLQRQPPDDEAAPTDLPLPETLPVERTQLAVESSHPYPRYRCPENPLACTHLSSELEDGEAVAACNTCGFPALLPPEAEIRGRWGRYRIERYLGPRGLGRLYAAQEISGRQAVVIREYLLPSRHFNADEQRLIRDTFEAIAGLTLADGRDQDFRLITPGDAVGDRQSPERCYLITQGAVDTYPTLRQHLADQGALSPRQVRPLLNQVLQSLESLHGQKYQLLAGQLQTGLIHGNLSLDSVLLQGEASTYYETPQLLVWLRDLGLWESLFLPPPVPTRVPQVADDLVALGYIGFQALLGRWSDDYGRPLKPHSPHLWPQQDVALEQYLRQLIGLEEPTFATAAAARQALRQLPDLPEPDAIALETPESPDQARRSFPKWGWWLLVGGVGLLVLALLGWWWSRRQVHESAAPPVCCLAEVTAVPPGEFTYAAEQTGTWYPLWHSKNLVTQDQTLEQVLETAQPDLNLQLLPTADRQDAIAQVLKDTATFAIAPVTDHPPADLLADPIAYDGLAVFVAFSYVERDRGLPQHLQGQISLDQLRQLYTGEIQNWQELGGPDLPVKLYLPAHPELVRVFEERVLKTPEAIAAFRRQWALEETLTASSDRFITPVPTDSLPGETLPTLDMLRRILQDFEGEPRVGSIGFASFSQIAGQCSIYPLAIAAHRTAVQPLYQQEGMPISPAIDLCDDKGNYGPRHDLFAQQTYPLAYPLAVFHRLDNSQTAVAPAFIDLMSTDEGQHLLSKAGLIPLRDMKDGWPSSRP
jgi:hypothetical protein